MEISHYSTNSENQIFLDKRQLSRYSPPSEVCFDLSDGYESYIEQNSRLPGCLDNFLRWILEEKRRRCVGDEFSTKKIPLKELVHGVDFLCWRGLFTKLAATPYDDREPWMIGAVKFEGVIFLMAFETVQEREKKAAMTDRDKRMTYWGHRFEKYVTKKIVNEEIAGDHEYSDKSSDRPGSSYFPPTSTNRSSDDVKNTDPVLVNCNEQYCAIFRTKIGSPGSEEYRLLFGAEIDCIDDRNRYVELKTSRILDNARQERNFKRFKLLKWWLQSFLVGIDQVICGYRDDEGIVRRLTPYSMAEMPRSAIVGDRPLWSGAVCMSFLLDILQFLEKNSHEPVGPGVIGEIAVFEYIPQARRIRLANNHGLTSDQILPNWFISELLQQ